MSARSTCRWFLAALAVWLAGALPLGAGSAERGPLAVHTFIQADAYEGHDWSLVAPYVTWVNVTKVAEFDRIAAAGIKTAWYQDPFRICATAGHCSDRPPAAELSDAAFMRCRGAGRLSSSYSPSTDTYFGDPSSADLLAKTNAYTQRIADSGHLDIVWFDNAMLLDDEYADRWSCRRPDWTFADGSPYSAAAYAQAMERFNARAQRPVLMEGVCNGNGSSSSLGSGKSTDPAGITVVAQAPNTLGVMCESFAEGWNDNDPKASGEGWASDENTALQAQSYGKDFVAWPYYGGKNGNVYDERGYYYASFMLIYDPQHSFFKFSGWCRGATQCAYPKGGIDIEPEGLLVPTAPIESARWPQRIDALRSGGVYAREFAVCYYAGVPIGHCAAVVNPDPHASAAMPALHLAYRHAAQLRGFGAFSGANGTPRLGDDGTLLRTAAVPTSLPPESWAILFQ